MSYVDWKRRKKNFFHVFWIKSLDPFLHLAKRDVSTFFNKSLFYSREKSTKNFLTFQFSGLLTWPLQYMFETSRCYNFQTNFFGTIISFVKSQLINLFNKKATRIFENTVKPEPFQISSFQIQYCYLIFSISIPICLYCI